MPQGEETAHATCNQSEDAVMQRVNKMLEEYHLSPIGQRLVLAWLKESLGREGDQLERVKHWILMKINGPKRQYERTRATAPAYQVGCPEVVPILKATPVWTDVLRDTEWVKRLEEAAPAIREELLALKGKHKFQQYRAPSWASSGQNPPSQTDGRGGTVSHEGGDWNVFYLFLHNMDFAENRSLCPRTCEVIESVVPRQYHHAFFSALAPDTHITKHHGPTNKKLRCQLPLIVPEGEDCCQLRVADEIITLEAGKAIVFDDSFEHEAWNRHPSKPRLVLVFDLWHPDLTDREVKFFSLLMKASMRAEKRAGEKLRESGDTSTEEGDDFYRLIEEGRKHGAEDSHVWGMETGDDCMND